MTAKSTEKLAELVRQYGTPDSPKAKVYVSEVRSDFVGEVQNPDRPVGDFVVGVYVIQWEYSLPLGEIQEFHEFLNKNERYISDSMKKLTRGAFYRGTYMLLENGEPRYRTLWAYDSLEAMGAIWKKALSDRNSNFYKAVKRLRGYWLRVYGMPAAGLFKDSNTGGDAFALLTIDASKPGPASRKR
jgi:hypothetical protein